MIHTSNRIETVIIKDAEIFSLNFEGKQTVYTREGYRYFCVYLDEPTEKYLIRDGWNIRKRAKAGIENPRPYLHVQIEFEEEKPKITLTDSEGSKELNEENCKVLDTISLNEVKVNLTVTLKSKIWRVRPDLGVKKPDVQDRHIKVYLQSIEVEEING